MYWALDIYIIFVGEKQPYFKREKATTQKQPNVHQSPIKSSYPYNRIVCSHLKRSHRSNTYWSEILSRYIVKDKKNVKEYKI